MSEKFGNKSRADILHLSSPIIHLPETGRPNCSQKRSDVVMVTTSAKVRFSKKSSGENSDTVIIHPGNFNLYRPSRSQEVVNGLQNMYLQKQKAENEQRKESAKMFLSFIRNRKKNSSEPVKTNKNQEQDGKTVENLSPKLKKAERFGAVRDSIELTKRSLRNSARQSWVSDGSPLVSVHLIHPGRDVSHQPAIHLPVSGVMQRSR